MAVPELAKLLDAGNYEGCLNIIRLSVSGDEIDDPVLANIAGICFVYLADLATAEEMFSKAVTLDQRYEKARLNLVNVLFDRLNHEEAIKQSYLLAGSTRNSLDIVICGLRRNAREIIPKELIQYLLGCVPKHSKNLELALIYKEAGAVWLSVGQTEAAIEMLAKAYDYDSDSQAIREQYGCVLTQQKQYHKCLEVLLASANDFKHLSNPAQAAVLKSLRKIGETREAVRLVDSLSISRVLEMPSLIEVCSVLLKDMQERRVLELLDRIEPAARLGEWRIPYMKAQAFRGINRYMEAKEQIQAGLEIAPNNIPLLNLSGITHQDSGAFEKAASTFNQALALNKGSKLERSILFRQLTEVAPQPELSDLMKTGQRLFKEASASEYAKSVCLYGLANIAHKLEDFERAFEFYVRGGEARQKYESYSLEADRQMFDDIRIHADKIEQVKIQRSDLGFVPIFVVGMPRSGTTLVTQILASHSQFDTVGETNAVAKFGHDLCFGFKRPSESLIIQFRKRVAASMLQRSPTKTKFIVEKMPKNFLYIHLLRSAFPDALILHVRRNPQATIWSNFIQYFPAKGLNYSFSLSDTVNFFSMYRDLMKDWGARQIELVNVDYGKLIERPRERILDIFDGIGVPVEENCFNPEKSGSIIKTASNTQVRDGITGGADDKWKSYADFLPQDFFSSVE